MNKLRNKLFLINKISKQFIRYKSNKHKVISYMEEEAQLKEILQYIPAKYFSPQRQSSIDSLYLVDARIARQVIRHILPAAQEHNQIVAETGAGLGLIASALLDNKVKRVRLYESCPEFRAALHDFNNHYPGRVELFTKNLLNLGRISAQDKYDRGNRVSQMLKNIPRKPWNMGFCMTVVGCMANRSFIYYLLKMMAFQAEIIAYGRFQLFVMMRPADYIKLTAGPQNDLHTYIATSVLFQTLFNHKLIEKYPRKSFLPWETQRNMKIKIRYADSIDKDQMYFVKISPKRTLPMPTEHIMAYYYFVKQLFGRGKARIIPTIEKWLPDFGKYLIVPSQKYSNYYQDISIYTKFGDLSPQEILSVFQEMIRHEGYNGSAFEAMVQSELIKYETRESDNSYLLEDYLENFDIEDLEEKFK